MFKVRSVMLKLIYFQILHTLSYSFYMRLTCLFKQALMISYPTIRFSKPSL